MAQEVAIRTPLLQDLEGIGVGEVYIALCDRDAPYTL